MTDPSIHVRRANERCEINNSWLKGFHSINPSDPTDRPFGYLLVHTDDQIAPVNGFPLHRHGNVEIVTWMLKGRLQHQDSTGAISELRPEDVQCMSAGSGIEHAELNPSSDEITRLVQMSLLPEQMGGQPSHQTVHVTELLNKSELMTIASGVPSDQAFLTLKQKGAKLKAACLKVGDFITLPNCYWIHLYVIRGAISITGVTQLHTGDRLRLTAYSSIAINADADSEILVWEMNP